MKSKIISIVITVTLIITACQKNESENSNFNVNTESYESKLSTDYTNALQYHNSLNTENADTAYFNRMFNTCDSLFSQHFYEFCIDMMNNSGMMSTTNGMMGNNNGMMGGNGGMMGGDNGMMNGRTMGSMDDMNAMMNYMDSVYHSTQTMQHPNYMNTDSLMHNQMSMCNMMISQTDSVEIIYDNMQGIRSNHKSMHGN